METLVNFSAGIDSVYAAWKYMKDHPGKRLLIHHINRSDNGHSNDRHAMELAATKKIIPWFERQGMRFHYVETEWEWKPPFTYGFGGSDTAENNMHDVELVGMMAGLLLRHKAFRSVKNIVLSYSKEECRQMRGLISNNVMRLYKSMRTGRAITNTASLANRDFNYLMPMLRITKAQMMAEMPEDLLKLCVYCQRATLQQPTCNNCFTCHVVNSIGKYVPVEANWVPVDIKMMG